MNRAAALLVVLLAAACGPAKAQGVARGIYGNVTLGEESGDLGGVELELIGTGASARIEWVLCEGWCNTIRRAPAQLTPDGFKFSYVEEYVDQDGRRADSKTFDAVAVRTEAGVTMTITSADEPQWSFSYDLEPIDKRFGLDVASGKE